MNIYRQEDDRKKRNELDGWYENDQLLFLKCLTKALTLVTPKFCHCQSSLFVMNVSHVHRHLKGSFAVNVIWCVRSCESITDYEGRAVVEEEYVATFVS